MTTRQIGKEGDPYAYSFCWSKRPNTSIVSAADNVPYEEALRRTQAYDEKTGGRLAITLIRHTGHQGATARDRILQNQTSVADNNLCKE